ncbi:hypothetical protein KP509_33G067700 [Ceratopteris richardii]|nr:hypothetical protein KP509_33G067700 [Ceratopteris richardii]
MQALSSTDPDLFSFLNLSNFFATAFIAKPRLLQLTSFMLQRVRDELAIYWHTWEKLPFSWDERWHEAELWFQACVECFKDLNKNKKGDPPLPETIIELAREFDSIEEATRRIYGVNRVKEVGSFDHILNQFEQMKRSELLTLEIRKQNPLCYAFLEYCPEIKNRYTTMVEKQHELDEQRKANSLKHATSLTYPNYHSYGHYATSKSKLGSPRVRSEYRSSA